MLQRVPPLTVEQAPAYPENLARYHLGAQLEVAPQRTSITGVRLSSASGDSNTAEAALLCDDPTVGYKLPAGTTTVLVSFPRIENVDIISFLNRGAKGHLSIATASAKLPTDSPQWHEASQQELDGDVVKAKLGPSEAKYVRLIFNVNEPGRIAALGVYSATAVSDFTVPRPRQVNLQGRSDSFALISYNLTNLHSRARVLYVSSGAELAQVNNMIDNQPATSFAFANTDNSPAAIIDLGKVVSLRRISALYSTRKGRLDFYVLSSLPEAESSTKTLRFDADSLAHLQPIGSADGEKGQAAIDFPVTAGRYIMAKWAPAAQEDTAFSITEIAAFSGGEPPNLIAANMASTRREELSSDESDGKDFGDGKDFAEGKDFKETPPEAAAPAEGPISPLPPPPPFTFIPVVAPVSP